MKSSRTVNGLVALFAALLPVDASAQDGNQPSLASVTFGPASLTGGEKSLATIKLTGPAGTNGFAVNISTNSVLTSPVSTIQVAAGQTSGGLVFETKPVATTQTGVLTATARGISRSANLTINPPGIWKLEFPSTAVERESVPVVVWLNGKAPPGGTVVELATSGALGLTFLSGETRFSEGMNFKTIQASALSVISPTAGTFTATTGGSSKTASIMIHPRPVVIRSVLISRNPLTSGDSYTRTVSLSEETSSPWPVQLSSSGMNMFPSGCPATHTVPAGQSQSSIQCNAPRTNTDTSFTITAGSISVSGILYGPQVRSVSLADTVIGGQSRTLTLLLSADGATGNPYPIKVTSDNAAIPSPGVVGAIVGSTNSARYNLETNPVTQATAANIRISAKGREFTEPIVILPLQLASLGATPTPVRAGGRLTISATLNAPAADGARVQLQVPSIPGITIPSSITIPAGTATGSVSVTIPVSIPTSINFAISGRLYGSTKTAAIRIDP